MKRILVPTDFSDEAKYACKVAASIAKKTKSEITLLHMFDVPSETIDQFKGTGGSSGAHTINYMKGIHAKFEEYMNFPFFEGIEVKESVVFHKAFEGVIEESSKNGIDLIVMGSQGATGLKEMFVGSNTEKVVRHSEIPVLVVKQDINNFEVNDMVFASDFSAESKKSFKNVMEYCALFGAKLHLLYVNTINRFESTHTTNEKLQKFIGEFNLDNYTTNIYNDGTVEEGILNFSKQLNADLIAINTHGRSGLLTLFSESVSQDLANHALRPVITFKI